MEGGLGGSDGGRGPAGGGFRGWRGRPVWESSVPTEGELEALCRRFPEVVAVSEGAVSQERELWAASAVVARSLGRRLSMEVVVRELRRRGELRGDVSGSYVDNGIFLLRFTDPEDRDRVLLKPLVVAGQAMAMEAWRPWLLPSERAVTSALVWVRLPCLPVEFWATESLREILCMAGELVSVDEWTATRRRLGYARVCVRIDLSRPLRPGVLLRGPVGSRWQSFVFESLEGVCLKCALFHGTGGCVGGGSRGEGSSLSEANLTPGTEGDAGVAEGPVLGPWALAVRRWLPAKEGGPQPAAGAPAQRSGINPVLEQAGNREPGGGRSSRGRGRFLPKLPVAPRLSGKWFPRRRRRPRAIARRSSEASGFWRSRTWLGRRLRRLRGWLYGVLREERECTR